MDDTHYRNDTDRFISSLTDFPLSFVRKFLSFKFDKMNDTMIRYLPFYIFIYTVIFSLSILKYAQPRIVKESILSIRAIQKLFSVPIKSNKRRSRGALFHVVGSRLSAEICFPFRAHGGSLHRSRCHNNLDS